MKRQRWRFTKGKNWLCDSCGDFMKVPKNHEDVYCCEGYQCGCYGYPLNPVICNSCYKQRNKKHQQFLKRFEKTLKDSKGWEIF